MDQNLFSSDPLQHGPEGSRTDSNSCPVQIPQYGYLILFNWGGDKHFKVFHRDDFANEIKDRCVDKDLGYEFRMKKLIPLKLLPGQRMSLFAKMESSKYIPDQPF